MSAANPRPHNRLGDIVELTLDDGDHAVSGFARENLVKCRPALPWSGSPRRGGGRVAS